jgi:hypothetical protein
MNPMTATSHPRPNDCLAPGVTQVVVAGCSDAQREVRRIAALTTAAVLAFYLFLLNPYWVPGGDSELYVAVARNWALGNGHTFNGQSVSISPPGWPLLLAGAFKISTSFLFLKLITIACMAGAMSIWFWILLRFTTPRIAALVVFSSAILQHVYTLTFWMHSDALFCLASTAAMLLACQINESRRGSGWRVALLVLLCAAATFVRWAGLLQWILVAGLLLRGRRLPLNRASARELLAATSNACRAALILSLIATIGTFFGERHALKLSPQQEQLAKEAGATFDEPQPPQTAESKTLDLITAKATPKKGLLQEYFDRVRDSGKWFSWLLWPVMRFFASGGKLIDWVDSALGWPVLMLLAAAAIQGARRRQWVWLALGAYCGALCLNWPNPNARYLVPVAPLIIWGVVRGIELIGHGVRWQVFHRRAIVVFFASIFLCNGMLYAVDLYVARSSRFYAHYEGGLDRSLIDAAAYINSQGLGARRLAVSEEYINLNKRRASKFGLRATVMLTGLEVINVPLDAADDPTSMKFVRWHRQHRVVQWYLFQHEISPWRVWHFRVPARVQEWMSGRPVARPSAGWVLFRRAGSQWEQVDIPRVQGWPTHVPGV